MKSLSRILSVAAVLSAAWVGVASAGPWVIPEEDGLARPSGGMKPGAHAPSQSSARFGTAAADTVWYGYRATSTDPNKVGVGGKWDWDTGVAATDSTQFWRFLQAPFASDVGVYTTPDLRPFWYFDYGNNINAGNHNLWKARVLAGRIFRRTGLAGVWHVDDMSTVPGSVYEGTGPNRKAWCGLRYTADPNAPTDPYTGNPYTNAEQYNDFRGLSAVRSAFPGYANLWNQLLYRDFAYTGVAIPMSFRVRATLDISPTTDAGGAAWFSPDPSAMANMVFGSPIDSFMVWVGAPKETGVYDTNRRWLSEVVDFARSGNGQPQKVFAAAGNLPIDTAGGPDTVIALTIPEGQAWGTKVRVVFQVHTNRVGSDLVTTATGFNSLDGAVVLDDVTVGGTVSGFDASGEIMPRVLLTSAGTEIPTDPATAWITTGRPPASYGHVHNAFDLPYDDPCGSLDGSGARECELAGNIIVQSDHDDGSHFFHPQSINWALSPVICLTGPRAAQQGTPANLREETSNLILSFDYYNGFDDIYSAGVWFYAAARYVGSGLSGLSQMASPHVANWSPFNAPPVVAGGWGPSCYTYGIGTDDWLWWDITMDVPVAHVDSLQIGLENQVRCGRFGSTACGDTRGSYWDNVRVGFVRSGGAVAGPEVDYWNTLADAFPANEYIAPGTVAFDTTTAFIKGGRGASPPSGGVLVMQDTLTCRSPYAGEDTRVDLVFRVWPGPGNYSGRNTGGGSQDPWALRHNQLLKVPAAGDVPGNRVTASDGSWWGAFMQDNGLVGSQPSGHTSTYWDPQTWNSARMDSAQLNYYPIASRNIGLPSTDFWMGAYHEADPRFAALGIVRNLCFLVDPAGPLDNTNTCCSAAECTGPPFSTTWPPPGYDPDTTVTRTYTKEGTKILPDGHFTPGTHIQYFLRRSRASAPLVAESLTGDTSSVSPYEQHRFSSLNVLPDLWKDTRFGGPGLACMLHVDVFGDICEPAVRGALDSLGYGLDNGSERGWKRSVANWTDFNQPIGFVAENLGQSGLAYDKYDDSWSGSFGCRMVGGSAPPELLDRACTLGPTPAMLDYYYRVIIWDACGAEFSAIMGGDTKVPDQAGLVLEWLNQAALGNEKAFWGMGQGLAHSMATDPGPSPIQLLGRMGALWVADNYFEVSGNRLGGAVFKPLDAHPESPDPFHSSRRYGILNPCWWTMDVLDADGGVLGAERAARYEQFSDRGVSGVGAGPYYASVYRRRDPGAGRYYATLLDGFTLVQLRAWNGASDPTTQNISLTFNNHAQQAWMDDALGAFNLCSRVAPCISVGEQPGVTALNFVRGAVPNPAASGSATVQFTLARSAPVTLRFYNVAGRQVHEATVEGVAGENAYRWDGRTTSGLRAGSGVYFYRLSAPGIEFENNHQRMVLLGRGD